MININKVFEDVTIGSGELIGVFVTGVKNNKMVIPSKMKLRFVIKQGAYDEISNDNRLCRIRTVLRLCQTFENCMILLCHFSMIL